MRCFWLSILFASLSAQATAQGPAGSELKESVAYYLGESKVATAQGREVGQMVMMCKRVLKPAEHLIEEHVIVASSESNQPVKEIVMIMNVDADNKTFKFKDTSGTTTGTGELIGEPWAWKQWSSTTVIPGPRGGTMKSQDTLTGDGLTAKKQLLGEDGKARVVFDETYRTITPTFYSILRERLLKADKK